MGSAIAKVAFQPPDPKYAQDFFKPGHQSCPLTFLKTSSGTTVSVLYLKEEAEEGRERLTLLWCHGNAEDLAYSYQSFRELHKRLGVDVIAFDYSGYGCSSGKPSESQAYLDVNTVFQHALTTLHVPLNRMVVVGRSLGSGIATELASKADGLAALILISPLASACSVAGSVLSVIMSPVDIFCNKDKVCKLQTFPVYVIHGRKDVVVPYAHGELLVQKLRAPVEKGGAGNDLTEFWTLDRCGHNDIEAIEGARFYTNLKSFLQKVHSRAQQR